MIPRSFPIVRRLRPFALILAFLSFGTLAGFSAVLHDHDVQPGHPHKNCAPCHWSQLSLSDSGPAPEVPVPIRFQFFLLMAGVLSAEPLALGYISRAPPRIS